MRSPWLRSQHPHCGNVADQRGRKHCSCHAGAGGPQWPHRDPCHAPNMHEPPFEEAITLIFRTFSAGERPVHGSVDLQRRLGAPRTARARPAASPAPRKRYTRVDVAASHRRSFCRATPRVCQYNCEGTSSRGPHACIPRGESGSRPSYARCRACPHKLSGPEPLTCPEDGSYHAAAVAHST